MKKFRSFLFVMLILVGVTILPVVASATKVYISKTSIPAGKYTYWYPWNDKDGYKLTYGATQKAHICTMEKGYAMEVGIIASATNARFPEFYKKDSSDSTTIDENYTMGLTSGYYKPYIQNDDNTSMTVTGKSYFKLK